MGKKNAQRIDPAWALQVASRAIAALVGGYAIAAMTTAGLARWLPMPRVEAVMTGMLASFAVYATVAILCFALATATRAWLVLLAIAVPLGAALAWSLTGASA